VDGIVDRHVTRVATGPLHIGLVAPAWVAVPPPEYGGTELVVDVLARGLVAAGHDVALFTTGDATCPVPRRWHHARAVGTTAALTTELAQVQRAYDELGGCDLVHDHTLLGPLWAVATGRRGAAVTTVHAAFTGELIRLYRAVADAYAVISISEHQRSTAPSVPVARVIHHGIDVDDVPLGRGDGGYVAFLGRMSPDKGVHRAVLAARAAGKRLLIAAKMWEPDECRYFHDVVEPLLGVDVEYVGQVAGREKLDLLSGAEALVNPIGWPEPFGLVMIEALAVGTPVVTFAEGSAPEIVDDGVTGFLCADDHELARRLADAGTLDRAACRRAVEARFSARRMVDDHVALYRDVLAAHHAPRASVSRSVQRTLAASTLAS
jgi:glycosyltransferase involved in cell wall biosynthesis